MKTTKTTKTAKMALHINSTGRVCFGKEAAERIGKATFMAAAIKGKTIILQATKTESENALPVRLGNGRPYVSGAALLKTIGFTGKKAYSIMARPTGIGGFEFSL